MLSQAVGYASVAAGYLAGRESALVREIADGCGIPAPYLSKIINQLARAGIVRTQRGVGGGVRLARDPATITLFDLCQALNDPAIEHKCMLGIADCSDARSCPAHAFNTERRAKLIDFLKGTSVESIGAYEDVRAIG